jgi:hypothetical protein
MTCVWRTGGPRETRSEDPSGDHWACLLACGAAVVVDVVVVVVGVAINLFSEEEYNDDNVCIHVRMRVCMRVYICTYVRICVHVYPCMCMQRVSCGPTCLASGTV